MSYVFITGASSGIGEACARGFAAKGWNLVLAARRVDRLDKLAQSISKKHGVKIKVMNLDVTQRTMLSTLAREEADLFSQVEVLVNNAGMAKGLSTLQDGDPQDWDMMIDTNIKGLLYVTRALMPHIIKKQGHIVNIGSVAGRWAYAKGGVYCATKAAVRMLTEALRMDLHGTGVRVTTVDPGMVETEFSEVRLGDKAAAHQVYQGMQPLTAADIADAVLWAVSRPGRVNIQEIVLYPTDQASPTLVKRSPPT